ncbi:hypothetical protein BH11ACT8_BH11ACT8_29440 [soil metagenome]
MSQRSTRTRFIAPLAVPFVLLSLSLVGCGGDDSGGGGDLGGSGYSDDDIEKRIEDAAGQAGESADVEIDTDTGELTIDTEDGSVSTSGELPAGFPEDVALVDGKVISAISAEETDAHTFLVLLEVDGAPTDVLAQAVAELQDAGYAETSGDVADLPEGLPVELSKDDVTVVVAVYDVGAGASSMQYAVSVAT